MSHAPGSPGARAAGCKCPPAENRIGSGRYIGPREPAKRWWIISAQCRLHRPDVATPETAPVIDGQLSLLGLEANR